MKNINIDIVHEELFKQKPLLAFSKDIDYPLWKKQIEEKLISLLGIEEIKKNACELNFEIDEILDKETYKRILFYFESEKNSIVPCYLLIPKDGKEKHPVAICLQGHTTGFHNSIGEPKFEGDAENYTSQDFAIEAVKRGYIALAIEQRGMGVRTTPRIDRGHANRVACYHTVMTALLLGRTLIGERVWDVSRAIDVLEQHFSDICDFSDITLFGNSGGGTATYYTAALEKRITTAMPCCAVCTYKDSIAEVHHCSCNYIPKIAKYMDMGEIAALIAPRRLIICNGELDRIFPIKGTKEVFEIIKAIYEKEGYPERTKLHIFPDVGHRFLKEQAFSELENMRKTK